MSRPSSFLYTPAAVREIDRIAIEEVGIPGFELMSRAGRLVWDTARARHPAARHWLVLCGAGNNAGDGYIVAALARAAGVDVTVAALADPHGLRGDAARAWEQYQRSGGAVLPFSAGLCAAADLIIDALLGTGAARPLEGAWLHAVQAVNESGVPVVAVDLPSGLDGTTGQPLGVAVRAGATVTFIGRKLGLYLGAGPEHAGDIVFGDLGVPAGRVAHVTPQLRLFDADDQRRWLPRRSRTAHKGDFGHVLVVGGNSGMGGAARLAGEAAVRAGAGLVSVVTRPENVPAILAGRPELMCRGVSDPAELDVLFERATLIAVGPGLGHDAWARQLWARVLDQHQPLVVDADALNLLAGQPRQREDWVLTPHPGEAARLLGTTTAAVQQDRVRAAAELGARFGGIILLKGRGSLIGRAGDLPYLIDAGNPGMASGGMGDVLTGLVAGIAAQHRPADLPGAAACAAFVHASAADEAARAGERGLVAGDLFGPLRRWLNPAN
ncbi:MAG: NAD(P)H-hydrate dehydratase [Gammaproteobacteria bacterium]|nr:NAD(P)H-hydrate dehydratase [Gammaproteobacteria bacterium]